MYGVIYKVTNILNGKVYIGQTTYLLDTRIAYHIFHALNNQDNMYFHKAIRKYGKKNFKWEILAQCHSLKELNEKEKLLIEKYNTFRNGYNLNLGGSGNAGCKHTEESRKRRSESMKGEKNPMYGKPLTKEAKEGRAKAQRGRKHSKKTKRKMSEGKIGSKNPRAQKYIITIPKGEKIFIYGLREFCRNYKKERLHHTGLIRVAQGKQEYHKGYKCEYC